jgi:hypothetical protein
VAATKPLPFGVHSSIKLTNADRENPTFIWFIDKYGGKMDAEKQPWSDEIEEWMYLISLLDDEKIFREVKLNMGVWIDEWTEWKGYRRGEGGLEYAFPIPELHEFYPAENEFARASICSSSEE